VPPSPRARSNLLPYVLVTRSCFIYHYMPALMYGEIMTALLVDKLAGRKFMPLACKVILAVVLAVWLHFAPWVYAIRECGRRGSLSRWRDAPSPAAAFALAPPTHHPSPPLPNHPRSRSSAYWGRSRKAALVQAVGLKHGCSV